MILILFDSAEVWLKNVLQMFSEVSKESLLPTWCRIVCPSEWTGSSFLRQDYFVLLTSRLLCDFRCGVETSKSSCHLTE